MTRATDIARESRDAARTEADYLREENRRLIAALFARTTQQGGTTE